MKTFRLLIVALLLAASASAQRYERRAMRGEYSPTVYLISVQEVDTIYNYGPYAMQQAALNRMAMDNATQDYIDTHRPGFQQTEKPQFVFASKNNRFSFSMGGFVALRAGYDFDGIVDNIDFVPYDIPVPGNYNSKQKLMMDASTSRLFMKAITNTRALGRVVVFMDADFRGGAEGSYTPRLRSAYVSFKGLTLGRDVTTFCDLSAAPTTIDFQGPNAYNFNFATMIRYEYAFADNHLKFGVAAEMPSVSGTYNDNFATLKQRVPDFPAYFQYAWGANRDSHIRASGVVHEPSRRNTPQKKFRKKSSRRNGSFFVTAYVHPSPEEDLLRGFLRSPAFALNIRGRICGANAMCRPRCFRPTRSGRPAGRCRRGSSGRPREGRRAPR